MIKTKELSPITKLTSAHKTEVFDCEEGELNQYLKRFALINQKNNAAQTYITCSGDNVMGYYTLAVGSALHSDAPERIKKGLAQHPVPVMILARLAIDHTAQGYGVGRALLKDALLRTVEAAEIAGIRALLVHAKDDKARKWYKQFDFEDSPTDPYHLFLLMKDLKALVIGNK